MPFPVDPAGRKLVRQPFDDGGRDDDGGGKTVRRRIQQRREARSHCGRLAITSAALWHERGAIGLCPCRRRALCHVGMAQTRCRTLFPPAGCGFDPVLLLADFPLSRSDDAPRPDGGRSEEHTSELQSLMRISYAVFCLKK